MSKLNLLSPDYEVYEYSSKQSQIDLVIESREDRLLRVCECSWGDAGREKISEVKQKKICLSDLMTRKNYFIVIPIIPFVYWDYYLSVDSKPQQFPYFQNEQNCWVCYITSKDKTGSLEGVTGITLKDLFG